MIDTLSTSFYYWNCWSSLVSFFSVHPGCCYSDDIFFIHFIRSLTIEWIHVYLFVIISFYCISLPFMELVSVKSFSKLNFDGEGDSKGCWIDYIDLGLNRWVYIYYWHLSIIFWIFFLKFWGFSECMTLRRYLLTSFNYWIDSCLFSRYFIF